MNRRSILAALALATGLLSSGSEVFAQFSITITVDENGNGTFTNTNGFFSPLPAVAQQDPGPGGLPNALTYGLLNPPGLTAGDVVLLEPGSIGLVSDIIRFNPTEVVAGTTGALVFYSDNQDGAADRADIGFPTALYTNAVTFFEVGPEGGPNGLTYTPTAGMPGFIAGAAGPVSYVIRSEVVPEPGPMVLGGVATLIGLGTAWARRKRKPVAA
jgi:hypothetical protein